MDVLGDMVIDAELKGDKIDCVVKCVDRDACEFISSFLEELRESLLALGCKIDMVKCIVEGNLVKERINYYQNSVLYKGEAIDLFA